MAENKPKKRRQIAGDAIANRGRGSRMEIEKKLGTRYYIGVRGGGAFQECPTQREASGEREIK